MSKAARGLLYISGMLASFSAFIYLADGVFASERNLLPQHRIEIYGLLMVAAYLTFVALLNEFFRLWNKPPGRLPHGKDDRIQ